MVTWENYEEYMVLHADGELQVAEEQALMAFVAEHPELKDELELCAAVKLVPDTAVVYANKEALMKPVPAKSKVIAMPVWQRYAVAAGIAAVICLSVWKYNEGKVDPVQVANVNTVRAINTTVNGNGTVAKAGSEQQQVAPQAPVTAEQMSRREAVVAAKTRDVRKREVIREVVVQQRVLVRDEIAALAPLETKVLSVGNEPMPMLAVNAVPAVSLELQAETKRTLFDSLPIEDIKKDGIADMASALAQTYKKMNALKHGITDEKNISVRVEKKQLIVSF